MKGVFFDLGKTLLDNYGYDTVDALRAIYNNTMKNVEFSVLYDNYKQYHSIKFNKAKEDLTEVKLGNFLYELLEILIIIYQVKSLKKYSSLNLLKMKVYLKKLS